MATKHSHSHLGREPSAHDHGHGVRTSHQALVWALVVTGGMALVEASKIIDALFLREVADVHRELYAENAELYGEDVAAKVERCLAVSDAEAAIATRARDEYHEQCAQALEGLDLLLTPTLVCVAPPTGIGDQALRETLIRHTLPFNALGWPALALPCGAAEDGLPASIQLVGRPGADALVLAAGERLAETLSG